MNGKMLKIIAVIFMIVDHIGFYLINDGIVNDVFRGIGRIAFPLFAFSITEGFKHTKNLKKYALRLALAAVIMEFVVVIIYLITGDNYFITINVFIPLLFGLMGLWALSNPKWYVKLLVIPIIFLSEILHFSYGSYGIFLILIFGIIPKRFEQLSIVVLMSLFYIEWPLYSLFGMTGSPRYPNMQWLSLLAFIPIFLYNGEKGRYNKWIFYAIYPLHLGVILLIDFLF